MSSEDYPPWVVLNVPHDSTLIPASVRDQFLLDEEGLREELVCMTDHMTHLLFSGSATEATVIRAPVSRLVVDVERFPEDDQEPMAGRGMGAIYTVTSALTPLRRPLTQEERSYLMDTYYWPHHHALQAAVDYSLLKYDRCLILDCHSFPSDELPYEMLNEPKGRPDICIGTDDFHTEDALALAFEECFSSSDWTVRMNDPFAGAIVPTGSYQRDKRVQSIMVEVNRSIYLDSNALRFEGIASVSDQIKSICVSAIDKFIKASGFCSTTEKSGYAESPVTDP